MTLVELLVVAVVVGLLMALLFPAVIGMRYKAQTAVCKNNIRQLGTNVLAIFNGRLPDKIDGVSSQTELVQRLPAPPGQVPITPVCVYLTPEQHQLLQQWREFWARVGNQPDPNGGGAPNPGNTPPPPPPLTGNGPNITDAQALLMAELGAFGCPLAEDNPSFVLDPLREPARRSFGMFRQNLGKRIEQVSPWMISESPFVEIADPLELSQQRHHGAVHIFFKDGHVELRVVDDDGFVKDWVRQGWLLNL